MNVPKLIQSQSKLLFKRKKYFGLSHKRNVKSLLLINSKRSYCRHTSSTLPAYYNTLNWTEDELKVLGTYQGNPTPVGLKKTTTGIAGVEINENAREILIELYHKTFIALKDLPEDLEYRKVIEEMYAERLRILFEETEPLRIEEELEIMNIEELVTEAERELEAIEILKEQRPWEAGQWDKPFQLYSDLRNPY